MGLLRPARQRKHRPTTHILTLTLDFVSIAPSELVGTQEWPRNSVRARLAEKGTRLFGPYIAAFAGFKGDLKARKESHFCSESYQSTKCCDTCGAIQPFTKAYHNMVLRFLLYTDFDLTAPWRSSVGSGFKKSPWNCIPGFHPDTVYYDLMHIGSLGTWRDLVAAVIIDMLRRGELSRTSPERALAALWIEYRAWLKSCGMAMQAGRFSLATLGAEKAKHYPTLQSMVFKGITVKSLVVFVARKLGQMAADTPYLKMRRCCMWAAADLIHVVDHAGIVLKPEEKTRLQFASAIHIGTFAQMFVMTEGLYLYRPIPKWHYLEHVIEHAVRTNINPAVFSCWGDESFLARVKALGVKCHGGTMLQRSLQRYLLMLGLRWRREK